MEKNGLQASEIKSAQYQLELKSLTEASGLANWHRLENLDSLSKTESQIVAARLVKRLQSRVALPPQEAERLKLMLEATFTNSALALESHKVEIKDQIEKLLIA